jgi:hypothetical protein
MAREIMSEERESYTSNWKRVLSGIRREYVGGGMGVEHSPRRRGFCMSGII